MKNATAVKVAPPQVYRVVIEASIEEVWDALTKQGEALPFFFGSVLVTTGLRPGAPVRMRTPDGKYVGVVGDVLEVDPPHRYSHTFKFTNLDDPVCKVTYELKEIEGGVEFTLINEHVPLDTKTAKYMDMGGKFITNTLKYYVEKKKAPFQARMIMFINKLSGPFTPKSCRSDNWPMDLRIGLPALQEQELTQ